MSAPASAPALLGRTAECEALDKLLEEASGGLSGTLVLRGEPGIGKSALVRYAIESAAGMRVLSVVGVESELEFAFGALHHLLDTMLGGIEELPPPQRDALASAFGLVGGVSPDRFLVGLAVITLLSNAAGEEPLLCVVEDAQWLDQASAEILAFVARRLDTERIALVFTAGEPSEALEGLPELRLGGLSDDDARELLAGAVAGPLDDRVRDRLIVELHGNPLALLELSGELTPAQLVGSVALPERLPIGERLKRSFLRRVGRLPQETQSMLLLVAAEPSGDADLLWRAAGQLGIAMRALAPAEAEGLLAPGPNLLFHHTFAGSAVYAAASAAERRKAHMALAIAADRDADPDRSAWHRAAASDRPDEEVAANLERTAEHAKERGGHAAAATLLVRAAELTPDRSLRAERTLAAAQAEFAAGAAEKAATLLAESSLEHVDELPRAQAQRLEGALALALGRGGDSSALLLQTARALERLDLRQARDTHLEALEAAIYAGDLGTPGGALAAARAARTAPSVPDSQATAADLLLDGFALVLTEGHAAGARQLRRAIETIRQEDHLRWMGLAFLAAFELWDDGALQALALHRVQLARETGALTVLPNALAQLGGYEVVVGRLEAAEACFKEARELSVATGNPGIMGGTDPGALTVAAWRGRESETRALVEAATLAAAARGVGGFVSFAQFCLAVLELGLCHYPAALIAAQEASLDPAVATRTLPELVEAAVRSGEPESAASAVRRLADTALPSGTEWALGTLASAQALVAPNGKAEQLYREGIDHLGRCRARPQLARARLVFGEWLRRDRRRREAREQLRTAHEMFQAMGAEAFAERAAVELIATGERVLGRMPATAELLTPHESRVAGLAGEGATNPEIAAQLFVSPRTVEYHLHKVFRKLGITSRTQLARVLARPDGGGARPKS